MTAKKRLSVCVAALTILLSGCGPKLTPVSFEQFSEQLRSDGYYSRGEGLTTDGEDGTSAIMLTDSGWIAGFYECADSEVAEAEFDYECEQAGIDVYSEGGNYTIADKSTNEEYLLYVRVENTCLFMKGLPEDEAEITAFAESLGYSDSADEE